MTDIYVKDINPHFRYTSFDIFTPHSTEVCAFDYRLVYFFSGPHKAIINSKEYILKENSLVIIPPGVKYRFYKKSESTSVIIYNFDYTQNHSDFTKALWPKNYKTFEFNKIIERCNFLDCPFLNNEIIINDGAFILRELEEVCKERTEKRLYFNEYASAIFKSAIIEIIRNNASYGDNSDYIINSAIKYIKNNYSNDITNSDIGKYIGYHPYYINRIMLKKTGKTLRQYLIDYRILISKKYLSETKYPINEISKRCGFKSPSHFTTVFKSTNNCSPKEYRKNINVFI